jgi:HEAT repeat protein
VQPLVDLMVESDSRQRSLILSALSEIGSRTLKPMSHALAVCLQDPSPDVRKNALRDLSRVYNLITQISHLVQQATEDPHPDIRDTAHWVLRQLQRTRPVSLETKSALAPEVSPPERL